MKGLVPGMRLELIEWNWRGYFDAKTLADGLRDERSGLIENYSEDRKRGVVSALVRGAHFVALRPPVSYQDLKSMRPWNSRPDGYTGAERYIWGRSREQQAAKNVTEYRFSCSCSFGEKHYLCRHVAAVLARYEKLHGGKIAFRQTEEEARREEEQRRQRLLAMRREEERKNLEGNYVPAAQFLKKGMDPADGYFHPDACTDDFQMTLGEALKLKAIETGKTSYASNGVEFELSPGEKEEAKAFAEGAPGKNDTWEQFRTVPMDDGQELESVMTVCGERVRFLISSKKIEECSCTCKKTRSFFRYYRYGQGDEPEKLFCAHAMIGWRAVCGRIMRENPGDATDEKGDAFLKLLTEDIGAPVEMPEAVVQQERTKDIVLKPRIIRDSPGSFPRLGFLVGRAGGRLYVVRDMGQLHTAITSRTGYEVSKKTSFDFSREDITDDSAVWLPEMKAHADSNAQLRRAFARYTYSYSVPGLSASAIELKGDLLDRVFRALEGGTAVYVLEKTEFTIPVRRAEAKVRLHLKPETSGGDVIAVRASGYLPHIERGAQGRYIIDQDRFWLLSEESFSAMLPLEKLADKDGDIEFRIGKKHLAEFYYRVLPKLQESGMIQVQDEAKGEVADLMPAEAAFTFYMDLDEDLVSCRAMVQYGEEDPFSLMRREEMNRPGASAGAGRGDDAPQTGAGAAVHSYPRDLLQENRVEDLLLSFFPKMDRERDRYEAKADDTTLPWILMSGVDAFSRFGEVKGTDSFRRVEVRPVPAPKVSVSLDSNLLDLSVTSTDMEPEELLALLDSYHQRKKWHRLKSGNFISLERGTEALDDLTQLTESLGVSIQDAVEGSAQVPKYQAIYVDRMLEEHERLSSSKSRPFRSLIRSFRTITDSDYEVPAEVAGIMRPYQNYGYQWLRTLAATGFGGILADEMGLGKTLQMLSCIEGLKNDGEAKPFLVVCPASLVYNWKEEAGKFTPSLRVTVLAGTKAERRALLEGLKKSGEDAGGQAQDSQNAGGQAAQDSQNAGGQAAQDSQNAGGQAAQDSQAQAVAADGAVPKKRGRRPVRREDAGSAPAADLYITSYDLCKRDITMYEGIHFAGVILDEAQFAKNQNTAVAMALKTLKADTRFALTGTPIENRLSELWNIFDFLMPGFLYSSQQFRQKFELPVMKEKDREAAAQLSKMTRPFILRRRKEDVLKDLPEKLEETQAAQMDTEQRHLYDAEVLRIRKMLEEGSMKEERFKVLAGITRLREICCDPSLLYEDYRGGSAKREACIDLIERSIDAGHRILLFSQFTGMLDLLKKDLKEKKIAYYEITGATPKKERVELVDAFNGGDVPLFLISLRAGGTGLNLTGADVVIHYDPWWNVAVMNQATDRAHRIGQTKKVTVVKLVMAGTIEEKIISLQQQKQDIADQILTGKSDSLAAFTDEEVLQLLE